MKGLIIIIIIIIIIHSWWRSWTCIIIYARKVIQHTVRCHHCKISLIEGRSTQHQSRTFCGGYYFTAEWLHLLPLNKKQKSFQWSSAKYNKFVWTPVKSRQFKNKSRSFSLYEWKNFYMYLHVAKSFIIIIIIYFEKVHFLHLHPKLGSDIWLYEVP